MRAQRLTNNTVKMPPMRRLFVVFVLVFLPFQATWAAVASYCQHETGQAAQHFGHHDHKHQIKGEGNSDQKMPKPVVDGDCVACHAGCIAALIGMIPMPFVKSSFVDSPWRPDVKASLPGAQPERPNWSIPA